MDKIISSTSINEKTHGNEEIGNSCKENELKSQTVNEITSTKTKDVYVTPKKVDNPQGFNSTNCLNSTSSQKNIHLLSQKVLLKSPLFKSPVFKGWNKSVDTAEVDTCSQRKRTRSVTSDYDAFKLELHNAENFNNIEDIDLLHDLDSVVKFIDGKDTTLLTSMMDVSKMQEDDDLSEVNKDPATDPLSISDCEKKDPKINSDANSKFSRKRRQTESKPQISRLSKRYVKKHKSITEEECVLEELKHKEQEEMLLIDIQKLMNLRIKLIHKVPPQHKIELSGSHAPTKIEKILFQKHGPIRKGSYTPIEDKIIKTNWEMFCKFHDWDTKKSEPFLYWRHNGRYYVQDVKERQKFVQFLANKLPWRTLYSVYSRFKILYRNKITHTRYTSEEDKKILMYIENEHLDKRENKYSELAKILRRTNRSIFMRYQYLKDQAQDTLEVEPLVDVRWTLPLIKKFIKTLLNVTVSEDIRELKDATLPKPVWQKMEEKLNIHQNMLKTFWQHQLHLQLFSTDPIYLNDIKIQLIEYMYARGISNTREIIWPNVAKYFDGATATFLCKTFFYLVQECHMNDTDNFADVVEYLYHNKIPEIQKVSTDKFLPKIIYKNRQISLLNENSEIVSESESD